MLSAKAVSAVRGCLLFVFQQVSIVLAPDADVPAPVLHGTADATPGSSKWLCADRSMGWGWAVSAP